MYIPFKSRTAADTDQVRQTKIIFGILFDRESFFYGFVFLESAQYMRGTSTLQPVSKREVLQYSTSQLKHIT